MDYQNLINEYIEGIISPENEEMLFNRLLIDKQLRSDFNQYMDIERLAEKAPDLSYVSPDISNSVFKRLDVAPAVSVGRTSIVLAFLKKYRQGIISSISTAAIILLLLEILDDGIQENKQSFLALEKTIPETHLLEEPIEQREYRGEAFTSKPNSYERPFFYSNDKKESSDSELTELAFNDIRGIYKTNLKYQYNQLLSDQNIQSQSNFSNLYEEYSLSNRQDEDNFDKFSLSFNGIHSWASQNQLISENFTNEFNNMGLGLAYELNENLLLGIDIKNENYYLEYEGVLADKPHKIFQNTFYNSYSAFLKYYFYDLGRFDSYFKFGIGANKIGFISNYGLGIEYFYNTKYSFFLSANYNTLFYQQNSKSFISDKFSINYGINLSL